MLLGSHPALEPGAEERRAFLGLHKRCLSQGQGCSGTQLPWSCEIK